MIPYGTQRSGKFAQGLCVQYVSSPVETYRRPVPQQKLLLPGKSAEDLEGMDCSTITRIIQKSGKERQYVTLELIMCEGGMDGQKEKESIDFGKVSIYEKS